jgi:hypothetical protein
MRIFNENDDSDRGYCWQIHLQVKLVLPATGACRNLTPHCFTIVTNSVISILFYREMWPLKDVETATEIVFYNRFLLLKRHLHTQGLHIYIQYSQYKNKTWFCAPCCIELQYTAQPCGKIEKLRRMPEPAINFSSKNYINGTARKLINC